MLKKLIKNEYIATGRWMMNIFIALFIVTVVNKVMFEIRSGDDFFNVYSKNLFMNLFSGTMVVTYVLTIIASMLLCVVIIIKHYYDSMFKDEGYLTFTLPVSAKQLLISKSVVAITWYALTGISIVVSILVMASGHNVIKPLWNSVTEMMKGNELEALGIILLVVIELIVLTIMPFFCITVGQNLRQHRVLGALGVYGGIYGINQIIGVIFILIIARGNMENMNRISPNSVVRIVLTYEMVLMLIETIIFTIITHHQLSKKINIE